MKSETFQRLLIGIGCVAALTALLLGARADAQTTQQVQATASLSWTNATTGCIGNLCNQPLTGADALTKVQVFSSQSAIADTSTLTPVAELPPTATSYQYTATVPNGSTLYFRVKNCNAICGPFSNEVSKAVRIIVPGLPTGVQVTVTVTLTTGAAAP